MFDLSLFRAIALNQDILLFGAGHTLAATLTSIVFTYLRDPLANAVRDATIPAHSVSGIGFIRYRKQKI